MKLYKIGELAAQLGVSARTIDYYTKLGLIQPEQRSRTNYRLYSDETLTRLKRIEWMKKEKYTLEEIKENLDQWNKAVRQEDVSEKLTAIQLHMKQLEREIRELSPILDQLKPQQARNALKALSPNSAACVEALLLLLGKGPLL